MLKNSLSFCRVNHLCCTITILVGIGLAAALAALGPRMAPIRRGTPEVFWHIACNVNLRPGIDEYGEAYVVDDEWAAYTIPYMHGIDVYCVSMEAVSEKFDAVVEALEAASRSGVRTSFVTGYDKWKSDSRSKSTPKELVDCIREAGRTRLAAEDIAVLEVRIFNDQDFWMRWQRSGWYWANFVFEWTYLTGLVLFALWPGIRSGSPFRWALHFGLLPILFLVPTYLGYATYSLTSAGPTGGIVYPYLLMYARHGFVTSVDQRILDRLPQVLEPLSTPLGDWLALTGMGMCGPICALVLGLFLGALVFAVASTGRLWTGHPRTTSA